MTHVKKKEKTKGRKNKNKTKKTYRDISRDTEREREREREREEREREREREREKRGGVEWGAGCVCGWGVWVCTDDTISGKLGRHTNCCSSGCNAHL